MVIKVSRGRVELTGFGDWVELLASGIAPSLKLQRLNKWH